MIFQRVFQLIALTLICSGSLSHAHANDSDPVRAFSDSAADLILKAQRDLLYDQLAPSVRKAYARKELMAPLDLIQSKYGKLHSVDFRAMSKGWREVSGKRIKTVQYTYAVATSRYPTGRFLQVDVTYEDGRYCLAGFSVIQFFGTDEPSFLKPIK